MTSKLLILPVLLLTTHANAASLTTTLSSTGATVSVDGIASDGSGFYLGYTSSF